MKAKRIKLIVGVAIGAVLLTVLGVILLFNALPKDKRVTSQIESPWAVDESGFQRSLQHLLGRPILPGSRIELLQNGEEIFAAKLEAIRTAEKSITLETYEFWGDELPPLLVEGLAGRARQGVAVHFIMDYIGSVGLDAAYLEELEEAGVEVVRFRRPSWYQSARFNHRTHRKLLVIDGRLAFTGGANMADPWLESLEEGGMRDNHFRLTGPVVGELQGAFMENWLKATGEVLLGEAYFPELQQTGELDTQLALSAPREGTHVIRKLYLLAIAAARENVRFSTAFFYADPMFEDAMLAASARGVTVEVIAPGEEAEKAWVRYASRNRWGRLLEGGIKIHEYNGPMYHAKMLIVDDQFVSIGSANLDNRSFRINDEANVNVFDPEFAAKMIASYEDDLRSCTTYDLEKWRDRPLYERVIGWAGNLIGPHL